MFNSVTEINEGVVRLRRDGGKWLKELREQRGLSQKELAKLVNVQFNTFISQLENGRGRIPPERYELWAVALGIAPYDFVERVMSFYDPMTHKILFGSGNLEVAGQNQVPEAFPADPDNHINDLHRLIGRKTVALEMLRSRLK